MEDSRLEQVVQAISGLSKEEVNSTEVSMSTKGVYSWKIKVYYPPDKGDETTNADRTTAKILNIDKNLKQVFGG